MASSTLRFRPEIHHLHDGDFNSDGKVDGADFGGMLAAWGPCTETPCTFDLSEDGIVSGADVGLLLSLWGNCESP